MKKLSTKNRILSKIKRASPFLLLAIFLVFSFWYGIIKNTETTLEMILIPFVITNAIYLDFALWNYFEGKKKTLIWIIETIISLLILLFI